MKTLKRILYVEDEPNIQAIARLALQELKGTSIVACTSTEEALQSATRNPPDLILLDVMMPGKDGMQFADELRANPNLAKIPIVFITARAQTQDLTQYRKLGALGVIPKPFDSMTLAKTIRRMWAKR